MKMSTSIFSEVYRCTKSIQHWLLPHFCVLCHKPAGQARALCLPCQHALPWMGPACLSCGLPLASEGAHSDHCGTCLLHPPSHDYSFSALAYRPPVDRLIQGLKYRGLLAYGQVLASLLLDCLCRHYRHHPLPELLLPVPLHWRRLQSRGFNQALEIARPIARSLSLPLDIHSLQRSHQGTPQQSLGALQRRQNLRGAFKTKPGHLAPGCRVALLDDVITTGATLAEISVMLKAQGVAEIHLWSVARTLRQ